MRMSLLPGLFVLAFCGMSWAGGDNDREPGDKDLRVRHDPKDLKGMGAFVNQKLEEGLRGKALAEAIKQRLDELKKQRENKDKDRDDKDKDDKDKDRAKKDKDDHRDKDKDKDKDKNGPGEALKHGLSDKDLTNFGRFVNEQLAKGLRGEELADAIQKQHERIKDERARDRAEDKTERENKKKDNDDHKDKDDRHDRDRDDHHDHDRDDHRDHDRDDHRDHDRDDHRDHGGNHRGR